MIAELKQNINFLFIAESAGIELKRSGSRHVGLCPFHAERTPSFFIYERNGVQKCHCFSCGFNQDVIGFVMKFYNLSFPDALKHLGIETGELTPEVKRDAERRKRRAELVRQFRDWEQRYGMYISDLWHKTKRMMMNGIPPEDLDLYAPLFHMLPIWEHHREILIYGNDMQKFKLYQEAQNNERFRHRE